MPDHAAWERLAALLVARRVELGFTKRLTWARDELGLSNDRIQSDLENARRTNYDPATLAQVEQQYRWAFGSIQRVLDGGDPIALDVRTARAVTYKPPADDDASAEEYLQALRTELYELDIRYFELSAERTRVRAEIHRVEQQLRQHGRAPAAAQPGPLDDALDELDDEREEAPPLGGLRSLPAAALDSEHEDAVERRRREQDDA